MKKFHFTKQTIAAAVLLTSMVGAFALALRPDHTDAAGGRYFGGMRTSTFSCSCSGSTLIYINDYASGGVLALVYNGGGRTFSNNNIYGTYLLGSYTSGSQCLYIVGEDCVEMSSDGYFDANPGTGTS